MMSSRPLLSQAMPPARSVALSVFLGVMAQGATVALLATSAWLITRAAEQPPILYLSMAIVAVRAFALSRAAFRYLERLASHNAAFGALATLRVWVYRRLVPLAPAGLRTTKGSLIRGITSDVDTLQDLPLRVIQPLVSAIIVAGGTLLALASVDARAAGGVALCMMSVAVLAMWLQALVVRRAEREIAPAKEAVTTALVESVSRRAVLVAFDAASQADARVTEADDQLRKIEKRIARGGNLVGGLFVFAGGAATLVAGLASWSRVAAGDFSGPVFALLVLTPLALLEMWAVVPQALSAWRGVQVAALRLNHHIPAVRPAALPEDLELAENGSVLAPVGSLQLIDFDVSWPGASQPTSGPVSVHLRRGDRLLIRGASGSGKTSLAYALVRFLEYSGHYLLDGVEANQLPPALVRTQVMLIEQQPHLFDTSIRHNLSFAAPEASDDVLVDALHRVGLGEWLAERGGLDQPVGERGALVSGGQAQRIALARALLADVSVLIVDEPTAHVDRERARAIMTDLLSVSATSRADRITIVITHDVEGDDRFTDVLEISRATESR